MAMRYGVILAPTSRLINLDIGDMLYTYRDLTLKPTMCYDGRTLGKREDIMWLALFWLLGLMIAIIMQID